MPADVAFCPRCGEPADTARGAGPVLVGFTILRLLGRGGAAVVYLARQEALDRRVAIKVLRRDVDDPKAWRRFRQEAQTIARLSSHPNVVTVYTAGRSAAGEPYIVTELLDRGSLSDVIDAEGALPPARAATIGVNVADALTAAHAMGILHRDVKPANVFLDRHGRVKLGDFGIARLLGGAPITITDVVAFTPEHVAPEVLRGEPDGPWSDVYGLASTLATCLAGRSPFAGDPGERVDALLSRKLAGPPPALPAAVPRALADPITSALDPDPSRRPSLTELRQQLAAAAAMLGAPAPLPPPTTRPAPIEVESGTAAAAPEDVAPARRWTPLAAFGVVLIAVVALVGVVAAAAALLERPDDASSTLAPLSTALDQQTTPGIATTPITDELAPPASTAPPPTAAPSTVVTTPITDELAAPASTAPPPAAAPTTTAAVAAPNPPTTVPAPPVAAREPVLVTAEQADAFVRSYYDLVAAGDYRASWSRLAGEFQRGKARSYEYYTSFWDENDIEVGTVQLVDAGRDRAIVNVELRWNGSRDTVLDQLTLRAGDDGQPLIADQTSVD